VIPAVYNRPYGSMDKEDLHLTNLSAGAQLIQQPRLVGSGVQMMVTGEALSPRDASTIYAEVARFGYTGFSMIPGGAQIASANGATLVALTGSGWQFIQDLSRSAGFEPAIDQMDVTIRAFMSKFPGARLAGHSVELTARWDNVDTGSADRYIAGRFLKDEVGRVAEFDDLSYEGTGLRLHFTRRSRDEVPGNVQILGPTGQPQPPLDQFDIRIEPLFNDRSKVFLQVTGIFGVPSDDLKLVTARARDVYDLLYNRFADKMTMEVR